MAKRKKTKIVMSANTKTMKHNPSSKHVMKKGRGAKSKAKRVQVKC